MRKHDRSEILAVAAPILAAEAVVMFAMFLGATVMIHDHTFWATVIGWAQ